jgi:ketosteroid isomerase-like protein
MSEEDLQLLITLDDPRDAQEEDTFNHLQAENTVAYWPGQPFPATGRHDHRAEAIIDNDPDKVAFGQGDWTCTLARFTGTTNDSMKGLDGKMIRPTNKKFEIEFCTVTHWKNGEIVEERVFYDLVGMQKQIGVM